MIDRIHQVNVYMTTAGYATQILGGLTSATADENYEGYDGTWIEVRIEKAVLDPDLDYFNSPTDFRCLSGAECGRFPELHGTKADGGGRYSRFQAEMWDAHRWRFIFANSFESGDTTSWSASVQ